MRWESSAAAFVAEAAALLPDYGPDKTTQKIRNTCNDRAASINHYFEQLASNQATVAPRHHEPPVQLRRITPPLKHCQLGFPS